MTNTTTNAGIAPGRINYRMLVFAAVVLVPVGFVLWQFLKPNVMKLGDVSEVELRWLSDFDLNTETATDADIPKDRRDLDGKRVVLRGEMWRPDGATHVKKFQLVYSIARCCVTSTPKIQHFLNSTMVDGQTTEGWEYRLVEARGTLHVGIERDKTTNKIRSVFRMDAQSVNLIVFGVSPWVWGAVGGAAAVIIAGLWIWRRRTA
jgi:hypothetical protein